MFGIFSEVILTFFKPVEEDRVESPKTDIFGRKFLKFLTV